MDLNSLKTLNPWWEDSAAINQDQHLLAIQDAPWYFDNPIKSEIPLHPHTAIVLRGCRQVGKTTLIKEKIRQAIKSNHITAKHCLYLTCETIPDYKALQELLEKWIVPNRIHPTLITLDEISFVPEWQRAILWMFNAGLLTHSTLILTGSNARDLQESAERFPGRPVAELHIHPISAQEYSSLPCFKSLNNSELLDLYFRVGGFPHAIRDYVKHGIVTDTTYETYANWIFGDAYRFKLTRDVLIHILYRVFDCLGSQVTWQRLIEKSPVKSYETASAYVEHLESAYIAKVLNCYDLETQMAAPRKSKKLYYIDPLLYAISGGYLHGLPNTFEWWSEKCQNPEFRGHLFESVVVNDKARTIEPLYYWYSSSLKREVDLLWLQNGEIQLCDIKSKTQAIKPVMGKNVSVITLQDYPHDRLNITDMDQSNFTK